MSKKDSETKQRSVAASRASQTRSFRKEFKQKYPKTWEVAVLLLTGSKPVNKSQAAVLANLHRDGYFCELAYLCNWQSRDCANLPKFNV